MSLNHLIVLKLLIQVKLNVLTQITKSSKNLATKNQVGAALDWGEENFRFKLFMSNIWARDYGSQNYLIYQPVSKYFLVITSIIDNSIL